MVAMGAHRAGFDPETGGRRYRERIGIVLQEDSLEQELTVRESLDLYATIRSLYRQNRNSEIRDGKADKITVPEIVE